MVFHLTSFLGAFLLFGLQPLAGRAVLPLFGGGAGAWMVCLLFFQLVLLGGYGAVHGLISRSGAAWRSTYMVLAASALGFLALGWLVGGTPLLPGPRVPGAGWANPAMGVLSVLGFSVGAPLLLLATTSPLVQACHRQAHPEGNPYALYATSNWGSMAGLLAYPLLLEPLVGLRLQAWLAAALFLTYLGSMLLLLHRHAPRTWVDPTERDSSAPLDLKAFAGWVGLAALGTAWLLVVSNSLALKFASVPLLWILPLLLYLSTFVLAFEGARSWTQPGLWLTAGILSLGWAITSNYWQITYFLMQQIQTPFPSIIKLNLRIYTLIQNNHIVFDIILPLTLLSVCCLAFHGRLAQQRPHASRLSGFYLAVALGGVVGGLTIGLLSPIFFNQNLESLILLILTGGMVLRGSRISEGGWVRLPGLLSTTALISLASAITIIRVSDPTIIKARDPFGTLEISRPHKQILQLTNGHTVHGLQYVDFPLVPAGYFSEKSGMGLALRAYQVNHPSMRVGVVGLGVGSTAAYARPGDCYEFYEISRKTIDLAGLNPRAFSVLKSAEGTIRVHEGDGRKLLEAERPGSFDVLVIDAFAGGHIPTHLLTREAIDLYLRALNPDGILIIHASHPLPLAQQVMAQVRDARLWGVWLNKNQETRVVDMASKQWATTDFRSTYLVISRTPWPLAQKSFDPLIVGAMGPRGVPVAQAQGLHEEVRSTHKRIERIRAWTDDRNSLLPLLLAARKK